MVDRITLKETVYMQVDGQWEICLPGTVVDVPSSTAFTQGHLDIVQKGTGTLTNTGKPAFVAKRIR